MPASLCLALALAAGPAGCGGGQSSADRALTNALTAAFKVSSSSIIQIAVPRVVEAQRHGAGATVHVSDGASVRFSLLDGRWRIAAGARFIRLNGGCTSPAASCSQVYSIEW